MILINIRQAAKEVSLSMKSRPNYDETRVFCKSGHIVSGQSHLTPFCQNERQQSVHLKPIAILKLDQVDIQINELAPFQYKSGAFSNLSNCKNWFESNTMRSALKYFQKFF